MTYDGPPTPPRPIDPTLLAALGIVALVALVVWAIWSVWRRRHPRRRSPRPGTAGAVLTLDGLLDPGRRAALEYVLHEQDVREAPSLPGQLTPLDPRRPPEDASRSEPDGQSGAHATDGDGGFGA